jgi:hypothetical protein
MELVALEPCCVTLAVALREKRALPLKALLSMQSSTLGGSQPRVGFASDPEAGSLVGVPTGLTDPRAAVARHEPGPRY